MAEVHDDLQVELSKEMIKLDVRLVLVNTELRKTLKSNRNL